MFESIEIAGSIYEGVVEPYYRNLPGNMLTMLVTEIIREEKPPCHGLAPRRVRSLTSVDNKM